MIRPEKDPPLAEFARNLSSHSMQTKVRHTMRSCRSFRIDDDLPDEIRSKLAELDRVTAGSRSQ